MNKEVIFTSLMETFFFVAMKAKVLNDFSMRLERIPTNDKE